MPPKASYVTVQHPTEDATCDRFVDSCESSWSCGTTRVKWWFVWTLTFISTTVVFGALFVARSNASSNAGDSAFDSPLSPLRCRLVYSDGAMISEDEMLSWSAQEDWPLTHPRWNEHLKACTCSDNAYDPTSIIDTSVVDVWLSPGDIVDLKRFGFHLPVDFANKYTGVFGRREHVKLCVRYDILVDLWGNATTGKHCHTPNGQGGSDQTRPYVGYDGALFCSSVSYKGWDDADSAYCNAAAAAAAFESSCYHRDDVPSRVDSMQEHWEQLQKAVCGTQSGSFAKWYDYYTYSFNHEDSSVIQNQVTDNIDIVAGTTMIPTKYYDMCFYCQEDFNAWPLDGSCLQQLTKNPLDIDISVTATKIKRVETTIGIRISSELPYYVSCARQYTTGCGDSSFTIQMYRPYYTLLQKSTSS